MFKRLLCAGVLASCAALAQAQPNLWVFTYTGFYSTLEEQFLPGYQVAGSFSGNDADGNGALEAGELDSLTVGGTDYFYCMENSSRYMRCSITRFSFAPSGKLDVGVAWSGNDEFYSGWYGGFSTGSGSYYTTYGRFDTFTSDYNWTDQTTLTVSLVPEPSGALMTLAGLLILGGLSYKESKQEAMQARE